MSGIWRLTSIYLQNAKGTPCVSRFGSETIAYAQCLATVSHRFGEIPLSRAGPPGIPQWLRSGSIRDPKGDARWIRSGPKGDQKWIPFWTKRGPKWDPLLDQKGTKRAPLLVPFWARKGSHLGSPFGPKGDRKWARNKYLPGSGRSPGRRLSLVNAVKNSCVGCAVALLNEVELRRTNCFILACVFLKSHCSWPGRLGSHSGKTRMGIPIYRDWPI